MDQIECDVRFRWGVPVIFSRILPYRCGFCAKAGLNNECDTAKQQRAQNRHERENGELDSCI
jgi:hypothetical protein